MKFSIDNKINLLRLTAIRKFLICEIFHDYIQISYFKVFEPFYKIGCQKLNPDKFKFIAGKTVDLSIEKVNVASVIQEFCKEYSIEGIHTIVGIGEYKSTTCAIPTDSEDTEQWFEDNASKFTPEGRSTEEYVFTYEKYNSDEDYQYFKVIIARRDYTEHVIKAISSINIIPICILPFMFTAHSFLPKRTLLLQITLNKMNYIFLSNDGNEIQGEVYHSITPERDELGIREEAERLIKDLRANLISNLNELDNEELHVYLCCDKNIYSNFENCIINTLGIQSINEDLRHIPSDFLTGTFAINKLLTDANTKLNLFGGDGYSKYREKIEKKAAMNILSFLGGIVFVLLAILNIMRFSFADSADDRYTDRYLRDAEQFRISRIEGENRIMKSKLKEITASRKNKEFCTDFLYELSLILPYNSKLTDVVFKEKSDNSFGVILSGEAITQKQVAQIISRLEQSNKFTNILLVSSGNTETYYSNNKNVHFKIKSDYYAFQ